MVRIEDVFGVSLRQIKTYIEREHVDNRFTEALKSDKQITVFGASKQGKTALVKKYINYDENIIVSVSPKHTLKDIYQSILRKSGVTLKTSFTKGAGSGSKAKTKAGVKSAIAMVLKAEVEVGLDQKRSTNIDEHYDEIEFNLELPDDVAEIINKYGNKKVIILENFHYLPIEVQKDFAFDLRTFQDLKVRFIIIGVWKESNKLNQFNGELQDRIDEIPVEPWSTDDFKQIVHKGEAELNITFSDEIAEACIENSFKSVGVFQELLKLICIKSGVEKKQNQNVIINSQDALRLAVEQKTEDYSSRHLSNMESIASGNSTLIQKDKPLPYFLHYYIVMEILKKSEILLSNGGLTKASIMHSIKQVHHRKEDLKGGLLTTALRGLADLQSSKVITPPVISYDPISQKLKIVDSTFYFFLKNADLTQVMDEITNPMEALEAFDL